MSIKKIPEGSMLLIGGAEDKGGDMTPEIGSRNKEFRHFEILERLVEKGRKGKKHVEIVTTASRQPVETEKAYRKAFRKIGFSKVSFIHIGNHEDGKNEKYIRRAKEASAILLSGGDQFRLATILGNTPFIRAVKEKYFYEKDFILAGTSAGATGLPEVTIHEGETNEAMLQGALKITTGLGFLQNCIVDTHFVKRGRFGRLAEAVILNPTCVGIGLGEDTALLITKGNRAECMGSGMVIIIDGAEMGHTNVPFAEKDAPLCVENLKVHILSRGNRFLLKERKFLPSPRDLRLEKETERAVKKKMAG